MRKELIRDELEKIQGAWYTRKTDEQLWAYEKMSRDLKEKLRGKQPECLRPYNSVKNRVCKLTPKMVKEIREKYIPFIYGKQKLAREYGVSTSVVYRIIKNQVWKKSM